MIGPWVFLECLPTRLIHYYLPAFPACALLAAWLVEAVTAEDVSLRRWPLGRLGLGLLAGIGITAPWACCAAAGDLPAYLRLPLATLCCWSRGGDPGGDALASSRAPPGERPSSLVATWGLFMLVLSGWLLPAAEPYPDVEEGR